QPCRLAGAASALGYGLRLRNGAFSRRSRRHRAVRIGHSADTALSAARAHGKLSHRGRRGAGAAAGGCLPRTGARCRSARPEREGSMSEARTARGAAVDVETIAFGEAEGGFPSDVTVAARKRTPVRGPGGAGKSTRLNLVAGGEAPPAGGVRIGGKDVAEVLPAAAPVSKR